MFARLFQRLSLPCLLCRALCQGTVLCAACEADLPRNRCCCSRCALPLPPLSAESMTPQSCGRCLQRAPAYADICAPFRYAAPLDFLLTGFKFAERLDYGHKLADLFLHHAELPTQLPDCLLPVPLHPQRLAQRGFNQAAELAAYIGRGLGIPLSQVVRRVRATPPQAASSAWQRRHNLRQAFAVDEALDGRHLAIVDDVMTTGTTVNELTRCLLQAGAARVSVWVLARAYLRNR